MEKRGVFQYRVLRRRRLRRFVVIYLERSHFAVGVVKENIFQLLSTPRLQVCPKELWREFLARHAMGKDEEHKLDYLLRSSVCSVSSAILLLLFWTLINYWLKLQSTYVLAMLTVCLESLPPQHPQTVSTYGRSPPQHCTRRLVYVNKKRKELNDCMQSEKGNR